MSKTSKYKNLFEDEQYYYDEKKDKNYKVYETNKPYVKCAHTHPPLPLGDGLKIYGGACSDPIVPNMDVSVGLDRGFYPQGIGRNMAPWDGKIETLFEIPDMGVPSSIEKFRKLIDFLEESVRAGKVVHVGCIGGHGRTGMVFAALVKQMLPDEEDSIGYVRANYCTKAVESAQQVDWLHKHFDIKKVKGAKEGQSYQSSYGGKYSTTGYTTYGAPKKADPGTVTPMPGPDSIWYCQKGLTPTVKKLP